MKDFFKKILEWIRSAYEWFVGLLNKVRRDRLYHFIAGLMIGAVGALCFHIEWAIVLVIFAGFIKEFIDWRKGQEFDKIDLLATVLGGAFIWICQLIGG